MIVLVCGGRDYAGDVTCLEQLPIDILIHGDARGADKRAGNWANSKGIHTAAVRALWDVLGRQKAGPARNSAMLLLKPDYCVAFPGGNGTANMIKQCEKAGIVVWRPYG